MQVTLVNDRFIARSSFAEKDIVKGAGFKWDPAIKQWWTDRPERAAKLIEHADHAARVAIAAAMNKRADAIASSRAASADIVLPVPAGLEYLPFQKAGIAYAMDRVGVLIGDEMGLGKTIQAIGIANATPDLHSVLIICPASLKMNWEREWRKWSVHTGLTVGIVHKAADGMPDTDVVILNYETIVGKNSLRPRIDLRVWSLLIVDEAHYIKTPKSQRTVAIMGREEQPAKDGQPAKPATLPIQAIKRVFLTGTPILNRPVEAWPLVRSLDPEGLGVNYWRYAFRYCGAVKGRYGIDTKGATNLEELQTELRSRVMVRRLKCDVLKELPPKTRQVITLEATDAGIKKTLKQEQATFERALSAIEQARAAMELAKADGGEAYKLAVDNLRDTARVAFQEVSLARHDVAIAKIPAMIDAVADAAGSHPVVVMAHHRDVVQKLQNALQALELRVGIVTGDVKPEDRQGVVDAFQRGDLDVFIGTIGAAGVGLTLTRASHVIFAELDWVPGKVSQAEDRCHRIGQRDNVLVQHYVLDGSLDARMAKTLIAKQEILDRALDNEIEGEHDRIDLSFLPPLPPEEEPATSDLTEKKVTEQAPLIDPAVAAAAHEALQLLAGLDTDRAAVINGVGFNKLDGFIGHNLARQITLTPKQAVLALRIARKYRRQLGAELTARMGLEVK